ncbi:hypothetical protein [Scytonema sp. NUACC26]|uniref:hypothetical protein n=1 Tax=Scytonema sp. NUACC26 TaxID=3140176 RepID=UPI0038B24DE5
MFLKLDDRSDNPVNPRLSRAERRATMEGIRNSATQALSYIKKIIQDFGGQELAERPDALGSIPIEISAAGVKALAASDAVKAVLEEQEIVPANGINRVYIHNREC